jgi:prophage antirepressor-like protein
MHTVSVLLSYNAGMPRTVLDQRVLFRLPADELAAIQRAAHREARTVSGWIRAVVLKELQSTGDLPAPRRPAAREGSEKRLRKSGD